MSASTTSCRVPRTDRLPSSGSVGRTRNCRAVDGGRGRSCRRPLDDVRCRRYRIIRRRRLVAAVGPCLDVRQGSSIVIRRRTARRRLSTTWITFRRPLVPLDCFTTLSLSWAAQRRLLASLVSLTSPSQLLDCWTTDVPGAVGPSEFCRGLSDRTTSDAARLLPTPSCCTENSIQTKLS